MKDIRKVTRIRSVKSDELFAIRIDLRQIIAIYLTACCIIYVPILPGVQRMGFFFHLFLEFSKSIILLLLLCMT